MILDLQYLDVYRTFSKDFLKIHHNKLTKINPIDKILYNSSKKNKLISY